MTKEKLIELIAQHEAADEMMEVARITTPLPSKRRDLNAMLLLDRLDPISANNTQSVWSADNDELYFSVDLDTVAEKITEEEVLTLVRLGVSYDEDRDGLWMTI